MKMDYLEDVFEDEYLADDGSDYKSEMPDASSEATYSANRICLPDYAGGGFL